MAWNLPWLKMTSLEIYWFAQFELKGVCLFLESNCWFPFPVAILLALWARKKCSHLWRMTFSYQEKWECKEICTSIISVIFKARKFAVWSDVCSGSDKLPDIICLVTTVNFIRIIETFLQWLFHCEWNLLNESRTCHSWARNKHWYCPKLSKKTTNQTGIKYSLGIVERVLSDRFSGLQSW